MDRATSSNESRSRGLYARLPFFPGNPLRGIDNPGIAFRPDSAAVDPLHQRFHPLPVRFAEKPVSLVQVQSDFFETPHARLVLEIILTGAEAVLV